jgi:hypothetical protein
MAMNFKFTDQIFNLVFSRKVVFAILLLTTIVTVASMWDRYFYIDDCWHGEEAYWLAKEGKVKTKTMEGILGFEKSTMVYHKLNIILGAGVIKIFGWSAFNLKMFTFLVYLLFFLLLHRFFRVFSGRYPDKNYFIFTLLLIFTSPLMIYLSFTFRPEILVMLLGFASYFSLEKYLSSYKNKWLIFSGILGGLAFFTHLQGMIFPIAGFILLLFYRRFKGLLLFSIASVLSCMLYTFDLWQGDNFEVFVYQITNWPTLDLGQTYFDNSALNFIGKKFANLLNEHQRFFWSEKVVAFSVMFIFSVIYKFRLLKTQYRSLLIYTLTLIVALSLTGSHIAERFLIYYFPFMALIVAITLISLLNSTRQYVAKLLFVLLIFAQLGFSAYRFQNIFSLNSDYPAIHREVLAVIPNQDPKVLAPDEFVFNEIENYRLLSYHALKYYQDMAHGNFGQEIILKRSAELGADYIVLDQAIMTDDHYKWFTDGIIYENPYYENYEVVNGYILLKRKN